MNRKSCQAKSTALTWDDLIDFAKAKIEELEASLRDFEQSKKMGKPFLLTKQTKGQSTSTATQC